jgi:hypothetical protein
VTWNALFSSAGRLVPDGWTAEIAIPVKSLRYPPRADGIHRWGFQIARVITSKDETVVAFPVSRRIAGFVSQMGVIEGLTGLSTARNLEILPTFTAIGARTLDAATGSFRDETTAEGALNLKYGLTSNLTADFTINPDFSQIESDRPQIEVNQRFPLLFPELRPFFLEGQDVFFVSSPVNLLNTRTIVDPGWGAKLTGKAGKTAIGLLVANDEAAGRRVDAGESGHSEAAPVLVARLRYDAYAESYVGTLVTDREFADGYSRVGGLDGQFRLSRTDRWFFILFQSSHRDLQGREQSGRAFGTNFRHNGRHFTASAFTGFTSPGFRTDTGVVRRVDSRRSFVDLGYRWWPEARLINWGPRLRYERNHNYDGVLEDEVIASAFDFALARNVRVGIGAERALERFRDVNFRKWRGSTTFSVASSRRLSVSGDIGWGDQIRFTAEPFLGRSVEATIAANVRPSSRLQAQVDATFSRLVDPRTKEKAFDARVARWLSTYQFSERLLVRGILEYDTFERTLGANLLWTYRVNAGTVFFAGYDDHYRQADHIDPGLYPRRHLHRTSRALFTKVSYLFRHR